MKQIIVDLNDPQSIDRSETEKTRLENDGWHYVSTEVDSILGMVKLTYDRPSDHSEYSADIKTEILQIVEAFGLGQFDSLLSFEQSGEYILTRFETTHGIYQHYYRIR